MRSNERLGQDTMGSEVEKRMDLQGMLRRFITIEGIEGSGKSTLLNHIEAALTKRGFSLLLTREPGGVKVAEEIRAVLLNPQNKEIDGVTEALLYAAARRQHLTQKMIPALKEGKVVLCDRYVDSSLAYQGYARGIGLDRVMEINRFAVGEAFPSLTLYLDVEPEIGLQRIYKDRKREINRLDMESLHFYQRVREGYLLLAEREPTRVKVIDARVPMEEVTEAALTILYRHLEVVSSLQSHEAQENG